jgi:hypothetical protein
MGLGGNGISNFTGGASFRFLLQHFTVLHETWLGDVSIDWLGLGAYLNTTRYNNLVLTVLNLSGCRMGNSGLLELLQIGATNESVTSLNPNDNLIRGEAGGEILGSVLTRFPNVRTLNLMNNRLGIAGLHQLVVGLHGPRFASVYLSNCRIGNQQGVLPHGLVHRTKQPRFH